MAHKYKVVDNGFNQANYPDLVGKILDTPPAYANVELIQDKPPMAEIFKYQSNWIGESHGETKLDDFIIKCLQAGYGKEEIIEGLGKFYRQAPESANGIFNRAIVKYKGIKPPKDVQEVKNRKASRSRSNWYKESQFTEEIDEDIINNLFRKNRYKKKEKFDPSIEAILPKDEDLRYFEDSLNLPKGKVLSNEGRATLIEKAEEAKEEALRWQPEQRRERRRWNMDYMRELNDLEAEWLLYKNMHKGLPSVEQFLIDKGREDLVNTYVFELLQEASNTFNLMRYSKKKKDRMPLTPEERKEVKDKWGESPECSFAKDKDGYFCYTHRARCDSYPSISKIPKSKVEFIESTS